MSLASAPDRPHFQPQNPAKSGDPEGWTSCTAYAMAMLLDVVFFGDRRPTGNHIRDLTRDHEGGLTLPQVCYVAREHYGVPVEFYIGANTCSPEFAARKARAGRPFVLQIGTRPLLDTNRRSTRGAINHAVLVADVRGGSTDHPHEALVYDPAADGRYPWVDRAPSWWPWGLVKRAAAALQPWGERDPRVVGPGRFYAGIAPPPRVDYRHGGRRVFPQPDYLRVNSPYPHREANVRSAPSLTESTIVGSIPDGRRFYAYQVAKGPTPSGSGSELWYGDETGKRWIHRSNLDGFGGAL